ncbi:MAG: RNA polymerase sigma factor [Pseudomonadota bacterium]
MLKRIDRDSYAAAYHEHFDDLVRYLTFAYGKGPPEPEDVAHQAFERLLTVDLSQLRNARAFLRTCAQNILVSMLRKHGTEQRQADHDIAQALGWDGVEVDPERVYLVREQMEVVMRVLSNLPKRRRRIFMLNRVHGLRPAAIARQLGIGRSAVVRHLTIASVAIADAIAEQDDTASKP